MTFVDSILNAKRPAGLDEFSLPRRERYFPSPADWRDEVLYFLLPDRFSDGQEQTRSLLDRSNPAAARPNIDGNSWRWDRWAQSGGDRWQGGTLAGIRDKLSYLKGLGISTIWIGPVFRQRAHLDTFHGYGIQDFLEVDPHFGTRQDLVELVEAGHAAGMRIILDIIFNHSGANWVYPAGTKGGPVEPRYTTGRYPFGSWLDKDGNRAANISGDDDAVWPQDLQDVDCYTRAGSGSLGAGDIDDPQAEHKRSDLLSLRDFHLDRSLNLLSRCYKYWIALTDCDGFRIDTLKHVSLEEARNFCGSIKEFANNLGKSDFFLVGEIAGGDFNSDRYLDVLGRNLNAALDIGEMRPTLTNVAKGLVDPRAYFSGFEGTDPGMGSHRNLGLRHVSILDDHDHVFGEKIRFSSEAATDHQVAAAVAVQLLTLGIPCIYYGTEQAFAGPEPGERNWLPGWKGSDRFLREAMFGPLHPCKSGRAGLATTSARLDESLPGFGPFGTAGQHCFDVQSPSYLRIAAITDLRHRFPALRSGRQYQRPTRFLSNPFGFWGPGELMAWSRILDDEELLCVVNPHGTAARGADIIVDAQLNHDQTGDRPLTVVLNTEQAAAANPATFAGANSIGTQIPVLRDPNGTAYVELRNIAPSDVLVLSNHP
ncbi:MAG TPA: alpha-amylase family glycosyl hydrolase [Planctomycetaceae bacterium]|nr:alpha-amylase family glycosyl hydrolase [Planctomycetaceae bacterium]HQZ64020.1 alpha-amylase family glycosyl hydrolase [Planctomycetaceae bacterium]